MKKLILPILFGVFTLFFSGKSDSKNNCGPRIIIDDAAPGLFGVTRVDVVCYTTGTTTTYNNPSFPITHDDLGYQMGVIVYFDDTYHGAIYSDPPCNVINFHDEGYAAIWFEAFCGEYHVTLLPNEPGGTWYCP
jgi:hypothetical protein